MILFLDTTYIFPYAGVDLYNNGQKVWDAEDLENLMSLEHKLLYCDLSLFEIYAKCLKLSIKGQLSANLEDIQSNLVSLSRSKRFTQIQFLPNSIDQEFLQELRKIHTDTFDCILLYLAVGFADYFITMDETLKETVFSSVFCMNWIASHNKSFQILVKETNFHTV
ncbi:MAG: hypothetical protein EU530_12010 [Promethearchaeota archaeon]|nr:MAG: hypothetical protein EU530_12010 [Candidatus Lokiarchaeota archaeon]